ncbi:rho guanine nucleotide exchange factor TIAM2 isoform X2 [Trichomycterus rosablanca]|uniref:rho guanine nucleotide exchange factor TIAM2 isoform X2 n=1 Tax=Trichomycterus rosablanca TaxID=2290929 RepID=UPI002F35714C
MGNTDSQHGGFIVPSKARPRSLKLHTTKEDVLSPHSWWRTSGGAGKNHGSSRNFKNNQPYVSYHYGYVNMQHPSSRNPDWEHGSSTRYSHTVSGSDVPQTKSSPKVLLSGDGSLRVEFTKSRRGLENEHCATPMDSTLRDSKGSSISSEESWYDSPWGAASDLCDNVFTTNQPSDDSSGYTTLSSTRTEDVACPPAPLEYQADEILCHAKEPSGCIEDDSGIGDTALFHTEHPGSSPSGGIYANPNLTGPFPTVGVLSKDQDEDAPDLHVDSRQDSQDNQSFSSLTLPCMKSGSSRKDSLKSRICRLSDWTGSLSRKKRRLQEGSEAFSSAADGDASVPCWNLTSSQAHSACSLTEPQQNQNVYENFMQELETGDDPQWDEGEGAESSSGSLGSLERMELMFEKEQGVFRRAGRLTFKPLIGLHKERKLELVARRRWRNYWVTLKGCMLLLSEADGKSCPEQETSPRYVLLAEDSVVQPIPEHPKRENVFCLSNAYGDVYLFQASNQTDMENWVTAIHSASASHLAKRQGKEDTLRLLRSQSRSLLQKIDMDGKMKKMAELQLSVIADQRNRKAVEGQIQQWEQNLEKFNMELFRMRSYLASLQGTEQPNPKNLLAVASRQSKMVLSRLGIFSVSSFHALMCTRDEATLRRRSRSGRSRRGIFSSQKGLDSLSRRSREKRQSLCQVFEGRPAGSLGHQTQSSSEIVDGSAKLCPAAPPDGRLWDCSTESLVCVRMPDGQEVIVRAKADFLVADLLSSACKVRQLDAALHCLHVKRRLGLDVEISTAANTDLLRELVYDELEVCPLDVFTLTMSRPDTTVDFGFAVTGHVDCLRKSHIYVSEVHPGSLAFTHGLRSGDEILAVNGVSVSTLDLGFIQPLFSQQTLRLVLWRDDHASDEQGAVWPGCDPADPCCPPPPSSHNISEFLEVPEETSVAYSESTEHACPLYQPCPGNTSLTVEGYRNPYSTNAGTAGGSPRHLTITERLRKVIQELVHTEKSYVKDLGCLFEIYLKPLENETFLSRGEMESLFGSLPEMLDFQRVFLQTLEEKAGLSPDFTAHQTPEELKKLLSSLGGSFLYYADHFKLYSGFCANHIKVQKVLERAKTDRAFKEFLEERNLTKQHSSTLESYLIKPVQRVLKYPLLLRELASLTDPESEEHRHLTEALRAMEKVASHINEMQKIYEDYGAVFDQLVAEQSRNEKEVTEISMGEFILHSSALWLNPMTSLGRMRKDPELTVFIFKRAVILVYREKMKKRMTPYRSADLDPFKFRWLIPASSLQIRPGNSAGSENPCLWELVHTKSEVEGRPETVFQLCSSNLENMVNVVKALRSVLRENPKRFAPAETHNLTFPRRNHQTAVRSRSWTKRLQPNPLDPEEAGTLGGDTRSEPGRNTSARLSSLTSSLEAQLQRLSFAEDVSREAGRGRTAHMTTMEETSSVDLGSLLVRDYSEQSLNSAVNEGCFYDTVMGIQNVVVPTV